MKFKNLTDVLASIRFVHYNKQVFAFIFDFQAQTKNNQPFFHGKTKKMSWSTLPQPPEWGCLQAIL